MLLRTVLRVEISGWLVGQQCRRVAGDGEAARYGAGGPFHVGRLSVRSWFSAMMRTMDAKSTSVISEQTRLSLALISLLTCSSFSSSIGIVIS